MHYKRILLKTQWRMPLMGKSSMVIDGQRLSEYAEGELRGGSQGHRSSFVIGGWEIFLEDWREPAMEMDRVTADAQWGIVGHS